MVGCIEKKQELLLRSLLKYYESEVKLKQFLNIVCNKKNGISLRIIDYLCTNYAKSQDVVYYINKKVPFNLFLQYRAQLKAYSKLQFDPFRRHERIKIKVPTYYEENGILETTVAQMNFFKWAIENDVIKYLENKENLKEIETHMNNNSKKKTTATSKGEVPNKKLASAKRHHINVTVTFK
uniref:Uncharacterized protein n=1 Tax=viral metagenome TaxID=1070528 RepID=A0A6C0F769_9ZZZZ|tara:strand:+ start:22575 stop:23117 length:543 start_codon:yes stop_codon:yes gene_type:complete